MTVEVAHRFNAPIERVWGLLADVEAMAGLGPEHYFAEWVDCPDGGASPRVGDVFVGRNRRGDFEWEVRCHVVEVARPYRFSWTVLAPDNPSSVWAYDLHDEDGTTRVVQSFRHGPGPSYVRDAAERAPHCASEIIDGRLRMLREAMAATLLSAAALLGGPHRSSAGWQ